jgi:4-hydroxy-3-polyprenylbenzoate decarboxylase
MAARDIREFLTFLEANRELKRIRTSVSADLEISEITDRICKRGGPALLFENVDGFTIPVVTNLFGSKKRMAWALGVGDLSEVGARIEKILRLVQNKPPGSLVEKLRVLKELAEIRKFVPKLVKRAPCQEVVIREGASLKDLPILKCWPEDAGRFITLPLVVSRDPENQSRNVGMYRMQVFDETTTGMHWHLHKGGAGQWRKRLEQGSIMEVAIALGGDPATIYTGSAPLPPGMDEFVFSGFLRREPLEIVKCQTVDLEVPAQSEIVLEGYVNPEEQRIEGPFGDHTGYYSLADLYPVFHLTCITRRQNPIYATTIVGRPPMEDYFMGKATERIFLPLVRTVLPEVVDMNMPAEGVFHNLLIVSVRKEFPDHPRKVMYGIWGLMLLMLTKTIVVVDQDVNVHDLSEVTWRVTNNVDPGRDLVIVQGPLDALDHASSTPVRGGKLGIDATKKTGADGYPREWPADIVMSEEIRSLVDSRWEEYGFSV